MRPTGSGAVTRSISNVTLAGVRVIALAWIFGGSCCTVILSDTERRW